MMKAMMTIAGARTEGEARTTQLTRAKPPPIWAGEEFEKYELEIDTWNKANKDDNYTKYGDLTESLKKNKEKKQYITDIIIEQTSRLEDKTVKNMIQLKDKYGRTKAEKLKEVLKDVLEFKAEEQETGK
jgi:uncharacterized protein YukE